MLQIVDCFSVSIRNTLKNITIDLILRSKPCVRRGLFRITYPIPSYGTLIRDRVIWRTMSRQVTNSNDIDYIGQIFHSIMETTIMRTEGFSLAVPQGPLIQTWIKFNRRWISEYIHYKVWEEITYWFPNFNGCTGEVWERISNSIAHFTGHVIRIHAGIDVKPCK